MSASEMGSMVAMQGFAGLSLFTVLLLMALGLAIIFGQMGVINMAHGEFMAIGAYVVYLFSQLTQEYAPDLSELYFVPAVLAAFFVAALVGYAVEVLLVRRLYQRPLDTLLATWGLSLGLQQVFRSIFGAKEVSEVLESCYCGRTGEIEDREPVATDAGKRALRCPNCGHLDRLDWLPEKTRRRAFEAAKRGQLEVA